MSVQQTAVSQERGKGGDELAVRRGANESNDWTAVRANMGTQQSAGLRERHTDTHHGQSRRSSPVMDQTQPIE